MPPLTRGPLPAGVYWRRRVFVLLLAATLVFVIANWLGGGSDADDDDVPAAQQAGADTEASQTITVDQRPKGRKGKRHQGAQQGAQQGPTFDPSVLVEPEGNCDPADVRVTPRVDEAVAGRPVTIGLSLQTVQAEACYFRIGSDKVAVKITRDGAEIWTSRQCPGVVPDDSVVVRRAVATVVPMTWDARESNPSCTHRRKWLLPHDGFTITTAVLGSEPAETDFDLATPPTETVTRTPDPKGDRKGKRGDQAGDEQPQDDEPSGDEPSDQSTDEAQR
jgi:hypothetical protein